jgi:hypothetical protein
MQLFIKARRLKCQRQEAMRREIDTYIPSCRGACMRGGKESSMYALEE